MPRKGSAPRRDLMPDPVHRSVVVTQLVNKLLQRGKRSLSEKIVYDALTEIERKTGTEPVATVKRAVENVRPVLEVKSRRVGGATYQVPVEVRPRRATTLAIRWIVGYARQRREKTMSERLAAELMDAGNGLGAAIKRKDDLRRWPRATERSRTTGGDDRLAGGSAATGGVPAPGPPTHLRRRRCGRRRTRRRRPLAAAFGNRSALGPLLTGKKEKGKKRETWQRNRRRFGARVAR